LTCPATSHDLRYPRYKYKKIRYKKIPEKKQADSRGNNLPLQVKALFYSKISGISSSQANKFFELFLFSG
jgi:hypothetical protein